MKQFASFGLDTTNECLWREGEQIALAPKPFAVLRYLVENRGRLITHDELLDALWPEVYVQPQVLRTYMLELRKLLGDDPAEPRFIQTVPKRGYCFVAAVSEAPDEAAGAATDGAPAIRAALVDRVNEMAFLKSQAEAAKRGQRRLVFVKGEAGIGKTALLDVFAGAAAREFAATVARGQCVQGVGRSEDYYPVKEALSQLCASARGEEARRTLSAVAPQWLPEQCRAPGWSATQQNERAPGDLCGALEQLAAAQPVVLVFDDVQWADEATLNLISALARRRAAARLLVVAAYRPRDLDTAHPLKELKQDLLMRRLGAELTLEPLERMAMGQLLRRELGQEELPPGLEEFIHRRSEGNPLFAIAILEHLIAEGALARRGGDAAGPWEQRARFQDGEAGVPAELAQLIGLEIERLAPADQRLLEAASLIDVAFPAWAVAAALEMDPAEAEEACDALARRVYFLHRCGQDELPDGDSSAFYVFAHSLYREVLYERQSAARRARRHVRIAERLGSLFAGREGAVAREMAQHYEAAGAWQRACEALCAAARNALERGSADEAAELLDRARRLAANLSGEGRAAAELAIDGELAAREGL
ncbi:MAG TPA: AAA family ATPase [Terracidiphilus sp.]|nr:AAA family ATPase [Terracidiphilus sp.]